MRRDHLFLALLVLAPGRAAAELPADTGFDALLEAQNAPLSPDDSRSEADLEPWGAAADAGSVRLSVAAFDRLWALARRSTRAGPARAAPAVIYGAASYSGRATPRALLLTLELQVTLDRPGRWKIVPLVGATVVLRRALADGKPVGVARRSGYHTWITRQAGTVRLELDLVVPRRGPRGAIEYDFAVARTPMTRFSCTLPRADLAPRLDAAITSSVTNEGRSMRLEAMLRPATRIHMVGFKEIGGDGPTRQARTYVESMNLLSLHGRGQELFSVIRYTILYAGVRSFSVLVPRGATVVSADGKGAFAYDLERRPDGTLLRGETAFPIRDTFELSLRLRRSSPHKRRQHAFDVPLPRCLGVERDAGWLAVEVPGKLRLREQDRGGVAAVDVRQLPPELLRSAVSPILGAYRFHGKHRRLRLATTRLPVQIAASTSIDRARAFSVVSREGKVLTELRYTLRNRTRRSLVLGMPAGARVRSVLLDGQPVNPSRDSAGRLVLPLSRSARDGARLRGITTQVVFEHEVGPLSWAGRPKLELPRVELPISTLVWSAYLPARNLYGDLRSGGRGGEVLCHGHASWRRPKDLPSAPADRLAGVASDGLIGAGAGAAPVRIRLPRAGVRLDLTRHWIDGGQKVTARVAFLRRALVYPAVFSLAMLLALAVAVALTRRGRLSRVVWTAVAAATLWPLHALAGTLPVAVAALLGIGLAVAHQARWRRACQALMDWARCLPRRFRERERPVDPPSPAQRIVQWLLAGGLAVAGIALLITLARLVALLDRPLAG